MSGATITVNQKIWGWRVAASLFLAGAAAGSYLTGFILGAAYDQTILMRVAVPATALLAVLGMALLLWHTGRKANFLLAFSHPRTSWMSRGAVALALLLVLAVVDLILWLAEGAYVLGAAHLAIGVIGSVVAGVVLCYTGMLLRSLKPMAFWGSVLVPILFAVSGILAGLLMLALGLGITGAAGAAGAAGTAPIGTVVDLLLGFVVAEAIILGLLLRRMRSGDPAVSVRMIIRGSLALYHWVGVVVLGLLVPLIVCAASGLSPSAAGLIVAGVAGLAGNAVLKYVVVAAGSPRALQVAGDRVPAPVGARMSVSQYVEALKKGIGGSDARVPRRGDSGSALRSSGQALKAMGLGMLVEFAMAALASSVWTIGVIVHTAVR